MPRAAADPAATIQAHLDEWEDLPPSVELDLFGTAEADVIAAAVDAFAREQLGCGIAGYLFYVSSVSSVHGLVLEDGRRCVVKGKPPAETNPYLPLDRDSLRQIVGVQRYLANAGYPCPAPLLGPVPFARGLATVEPYLDVGETRLGHDPDVRRSIACGLHEHVALLLPLVDSVRLRHFHAPSDRLFPQPHSKIFAPSEADTVWVRDLARRARDIAEPIASRIVLGHADWRVEHVAFDGDRIVGTYDWDSLCRGPEIGLVGGNAHGHSADWSQEAVRRVPTHDAILDFIEAYERARGEPFTAAEHRGTRAWAAYWIAYGAWISIEPGTTDWPDDSWPALLRDCGGKLLV